MSALCLLLTLFTYETSLSLTALYLSDLGGLRGEDPCPTPKQEAIGLWTTIWDWFGLASPSLIQGSTRGTMGPYPTHTLPIPIRSVSDGPLQTGFASNSS